MPDIFNRTSQGVAGTMSADNTSFTFAGGSVGFITQQLGVNYQQPINRLYSIGTTDAYMVAGRPRGDGSINCVVGPGALTDDFLIKYGNVCNAKDNTLSISFGASCGGNNSNAKSITVTGVVITNVSDSVRSEDMIISEAIQFTFLSMTRQ